MTDSPQQRISAELRQHLPHFTGDVQRYRHSLIRNVIYTEGVQYLAETAGAFWLIDAIASHLNSPEFRQAAEQDPRIVDLHFWRLAVADDSSARLSARADTDVPTFIQQAIRLTDFPLPQLDVWVGFDGQYFTLYLPSEH